MPLRIEKNTSRTVLPTSTFQLIKRISFEFQERRNVIFVSLIVRNVNFCFLVSALVLWAQLGGGHGERVPPLFRTVGI